MKSESSILNSQFFCKGRPSTYPSIYHVLIVSNTKSSRENITSHQYLITSGYLHNPSLPLSPLLSLTPFPSLPSYLPYFLPSTPRPRFSNLLLYSSTDSIFLVEGAGVKGKEGGGSGWLVGGKVLEGRKGGVFDVANVMYVEEGGEGFERYCCRVEPQFFYLDINRYA